MRAIQGIRLPPRAFGIYSSLMIARAAGVVDASPRSGRGHVAHGEAVGNGIERKSRSPGRGGIGDLVRQKPIVGHARLPVNGARCRPYGAGELILPPRFSHGEAVGREIGRKSSSPGRGVVGGFVRQKPGGGACPTPCERCRMSPLRGWRINSIPPVFPRLCHGLHDRARCAGFRARAVIFSCQI